MRSHLITILVIIGLLIILCILDRKNGCRCTDSIGKFLNNNPFVKTLLFVVTVILAGVFCSAFVFEIGRENTLDWSKFYTLDSFYYLVYVIIFDFCYNWVVHTYDDILKYNDESYCRAYVRKECLSTQIAKFKTQIENGEKELKINDLFR